MEKLLIFSVPVMRLFIGEIPNPQKLYALINKLNTKLLYAKVVLDEEEDNTLILEHDFNAASVEQLSESIYDFLVDVVDEDVSPLIEELLKEIRD